MSPRRAFPFKCSAVVSDVDGTLVTNDKVLTSGARTAVAALRARRIVFSVISSRPPRGLRMLLEPLGITTPVSGFNGGVVANPDFSIISEHVLAPEIARNTVGMLKALGLQVWLFSGEDWLLRDAAAPYVAVEEHTVGFLPNVVSDFGTSLNTAAKIVGVSKDFELLARCEGALRDALAGKASVERSQPYYLDITHPLANKGVTLSQVAKLLSIALAEIAVVGDGSNDVAMFERSGLSIAMGNAEPEVQQAADFVTDSNGKEGFAHAIERFILGNGHPDARIDPARSGVRA
jgi:Cof subfamily protein (haloacid dehalogenase superfamily)